MVRLDAQVAALTCASFGLDVGRLDDGRPAGNLLLHQRREPLLISNASRTHRA